MNSVYQGHYARVGRPLERSVLSLMPDTTPILRLLRDLVRRARTNRLIQEFVDSAGGALAVWLFMALWNATMPRQVVLGWPFFMLVGVVAVVRTVARCARPVQLRQAASRADDAAGLTDELTSAYWFVRNPQEDDDWVGLHVERAADTARGLDGSKLLPVCRPQRLGLATGCLAGLMAVVFFPVPRVFEDVVDRLSDMTLSEEFVDQSMEALSALEEAADADPDGNESQPPVGDEQLLMSQPDAEGERTENAIEEDSVLEEQQPDPEGAFTEGEEAGEEAGEEGEQNQVDNPEDLPAETEGEKAPDPNASQQEGQGESTEESGTTLPGGDEVFLQQGTDEADPTQLGEEEVGHATREGGEEQELVQGELSTLEVELQREILAIPEEEDEEELEEQEELVIEAEASQLKFQTVESLSEFAEQELMQTETVPWSYRDLVRGYFQTMRKRDNQKEDEGR